MKSLVLCILFLSYFHGFAQELFHGLVCDSLTKKPLAFATIKSGNKQAAVLTNIDGHFTVQMQNEPSKMIVSYVGYVSRTIPYSKLRNNDTIFLSPGSANLKEFTVLPLNDKIRHIINSAIRNKPLNNPDLYEQYQCSIYYKMYADPILNEKIKKDTLSIPPTSKLPGNVDTKRKITAADSNSLKKFIEKNHLMFSETYSKRSFRRPKQLQEDVIASKFSGLKKTYFTFLVTDVLPFHVYGDYITLNSLDYINPIAKGWQQRYHFNLVDELYSGSDTIFILTFQPKKNTSFNALKGIVYINSDGYAISNFISSTGDSSSDREAKIEQKYEKVDGKWFPKELNYDLVLKKYPSPQLGIRLNGHSVISNVAFNNDGVSFQKAHPVTLGDSVDLHSEKEWMAIRPDTLNKKERSTYHVLDSMSAQMKLEKKMNSIGKLAVGKLGVGIFDLDINRFFVYNQYEKERVGLGLSTNDKVSKYYSIGAWAGYGFNDARWKYGASATFFPAGDKENWLKFSYQDNYQSAGDVHIHPDIDNAGFRNWLLYKVDRIKEYAFAGITQRGYWELELNAASQQLQSYYDNNFEYGGKNLTSYSVSQVGIGVKYAYAERRIPMFGYYLSTTTQYPIVYFRMDGGKISSGEYSTNFLKPIAAITFNKHFNRWGNDRFQLEAAAIFTTGNQPLSRSFLLAGKGFNNNFFNYYAWGGFLTMHPYDYFSDRYVSFFYRHDFDKFLWQLKFSKPFISIAQNLIYGRLGNETKLANLGISSPTNGYQESGILLNQLLSINYFHLANLYLNGGLFYHWNGPYDWNKNGLLVAGISIGF